MYIAKYMTRYPVTITPETTVIRASAILASKDFRHLPVVDERGCLVGMVTDRDIRSAFPSTLAPEEDRTAELEDLSHATVSAIMSRDLVTLSPTSTLDDALLILQRKKVGAVPVVDGTGMLVGIFSIRDLIKAYSVVFGLGEKGSCLVEIRDSGEPATLRKLVRVLEENDIPFTRLVRSTAEGVIYVRVTTYNIKNVHRIMREEGLELVNAKECVGVSP